jgi:hypothetical protein
MKQKIHIGLLSMEAMACVLFLLLQTSFSGVFSTIMAFPFEQMGMGLRFLSLSGGWGNAAAIAIYLTVSLSPAAALLVVRKKRKLHAEDGLLGLLCAVHFAVLYIMVNPGVINAWPGGLAAQPVGKAFLGGMVYSVLSGYFVLRVLRLFASGGTEKLLRYMSVMLRLLTVLFVYLIFGAYFNGLLQSITALQAGNVGNEHLLNASYVFLVLQFIANALPIAFNMLVVFAALRLLDAMGANRYSAETVAAAGQVSGLCAAALVATALVNIGFNLLQFLFAKSLFVVNGSVQIPVFSVAFILASLLLTRLVTDGKRLKDDNEMFI